MQQAIQSPMGPSRTPQTIKRRISSLLMDFLFSHWLGVRLVWYWEVGGDFGAVEYTGGGRTVNMSDVDAFTGTRSDDAVCIGIEISGPDLLLPVSVTTWPWSSLTSLVDGTTGIAVASWFICIMIKRLSGFLSTASWSACPLKVDVCSS